MRESAWPEVKLREVSEVISKGTTPTTLGYSFTSTGVAFLRAEDIINGVINPRTVAFHISPETHSVLSRSQLLPGDLLITIAGTLGRIGYVPRNAPPLNCNQAVAFARLKPDLLDSKFACLMCQCEDVISPLLNLKKVGTIGNLNLEQVGELKIPLPPLSEQKRIAAILERANGLRHLCRYSQQLNEEFLHSVFMQMFGHIENFDWIDFKSLFIEEPKNGLYLPAEQYGNGVPIIRINNFYAGVLDSPMTFKRVRASDSEIEEFSVRNEDILINRVNSLEYLGKCALVHGIVEPTLFESNMMRIRVKNEKVSPVYLVKFLSGRNAYLQIQRVAKKAVNQASINQTDVESFRILLPPKEQQEKFARIVQKCERLFLQRGESKRQAEHLFQILLRRALTGKL